MGTGPFAVPSFEALRASGQHELAMVITRPVTNAADAKNKTLANPVRAWADQHRLEVIAPPSINGPEAISTLAAWQPDLLVVCDYGQILSANALATARLGGINLHGSLLPRHRGAAPVQWSILRGDKVTGACVIHMTPRLDGGPILARVETEIGEEETAGELEERLSQLGIQCCLEAISKLEGRATLDACEQIGDRQENSLATPAPRLAKADGQLDFRYPARLIDRQIRGLQPWPGAFGTLQLGDSKELRVIVGKARPWAGSSIPALPPENSLLSGQAYPGISPGTLFWGPGLQEILALDSETGLAASQPIPLLVVACVDKFLEIVQLQPAGKKMQSAREFLAGYGRAESMRFLPPPPEAHHRLLEIMSISGI